MAHGAGVMPTRPGDRPTRESISRFGRDARKDLKVPSHHEPSSLDW